MWGFKKGARALASGAVAALLAAFIVQADETIPPANPVSFRYNAKEVYSAIRNRNRPPWKRFPWNWKASNR